MDLRSFETDATKSEKGVWVSIGEDGAALLLAKLPNPAFDKRMEALRKPYRGLIRTGGSIPEDKAQEITARAISETVLLGWRGLTNGGEPMEYSREMAYSLLNDRKMRDFANLVVELAREKALFAPDDIEADAKN